MLPFTPTITHVFVILALLGFGAVGSLGALVFRARSVATIVAHASAGLASIVGLMFSLSVLVSHEVIAAAYQSPFAPLVYSFSIDRLSALFIALISIGVGAASVYGVGYVTREHAIHTPVFGMFYTLFVASLYVVVSAHNALFFLIAWEVMSLTSYALIVHEHTEATNVHAGFMYLLMTHVGTAFLTLALMLLGTAAGSYEFAAFRALTDLSPLITHAVLATALLGLCIKTGVVPFHVWLPLAHPAAPSHVSALLSGVMLKMAVYMIIRVLFDLVTPSGLLWWGIGIVVVGAVSAVLGILYALAQKDLKRLLAYSSVENIGLILIAIGVAAIAQGTAHDTLAELALIAALFHSVNHALFKGLLFMGAGSVVLRTHTRNMERYGGLIHILPVTAALFLLGSIAITGLPPLNGFASELVLFRALIEGALVSPLYLKAFFVIIVGCVALASGLAAASFVKAFGLTFLSTPRHTYDRGEKEGIAQRESVTMNVGMGLLALAIVGVSVYAGQIVSLLGEIVGDLVLRTNDTAHVLSVDGVSVLATPVILAALVTALLLIYVCVRVITWSRTTVVGPVWACGAPVEEATFAAVPARVRITATGFAQTLVVIFRSLVHVEIERTGSLGGAEEAVHVRHRDQFLRKGYVPLSTYFLAITARVRSMQGGNVNAYLLYIFITLCVLLFAAL